MGVEVSFAISQSRITAFQLTELMSNSDETKPGPVLVVLLEDLESMNASVLGSILQTFRFALSATLLTQEADDYNLAYTYNLCRFHS
jgi:hypothetical protein